MLHCCRCSHDVVEVGGEEGKAGKVRRVEDQGVYTGYTPFLYLIDSRLICNALSRIPLSTDGSVQI